MVRVQMEKDRKVLTKDIPHQREMDQVVVKVVVVEVVEVEETEVIKK
jgi:hypothetical protein